MLADSTGQIPAKMWDNVAPAAERFDVDDVIRIKGASTATTAVSIHHSPARGQAGREGHRFRRLPAEDQGRHRAALARAVRIRRDHARAVPEGAAAGLHGRRDDLVRAYKQAPAAKTLHHACIGGLLEHVVSLIRTCDLVVRNYPLVNRDLLLTGACLHDIGKIHELSYSRSFGYTTEGQLLGHMVIELEMLHAKMAQLGGFPDELKVVLEHLIISHHGAYEFGSPKLPMFPEALMLHCLDDLDSKMESMRAQLERDADLDSAWTNYNQSLARPLLNTRKYLNDLESKTQAAAAGSEDKHPEK